MEEFNLEMISRSELISARKLSNSDDKVEMSVSLILLDGKITVGIGF